MSGKSVVPGRGRKAKPTAAKKQDGNPGKRKISGDEPAFKMIEGVEAPEWLSDDARTMWNLITGELCKAKVIAVTDLHNVEAFCTAYSNWRAAQKYVNKNGIVVTGGQGGPIKNPALTAANEALRQMASFGSSLGLTPSARVSLVGQAGEGPGEFDEF
ncbi:MAG: phage terminase small subunit P27 family [Idiomarina sp.]|nr:phage terminase small subunit P27 family [Idiomarina sp.]